MEDNTPTAPAPAPQAGESVAPNINSNQGGENANTGNTNTNDNPAPTPQVSEKAQIPADQVEAWNRFMENNGGFEKAFKKVKDTIANPQSQTQAQTMGNVPETVTNEQQPTQLQAQPAKPAEGYLTANDIAKLQYNKMLSEAYSELDKDGYITKGEFVKEASSLGIQVMDAQGNMNDASIRKFLDLKKATIPPAPTSTPMTTTPTVEYVHSEGDITSQEVADAIMKQGNSHPRYAEAMKFTRERIFGKKPEQTQK